MIVEFLIQKEEEVWNRAMVSISKGEKKK